MICAPQQIASSPNGDAEKLQTLAKSAIPVLLGVFLSVQRWTRSLSCRSYARCSSSEGEELAYFLGPGAAGTFHCRQGGCGGMLRRRPQRERGPGLLLSWRPFVLIAVPVLALIPSRLIRWLAYPPCSPWFPALTPRRGCHPAAYFRPQRQTPGVESRCACGPRKEPI